MGIGDANATDVDIVVSDRDGDKAEAARVTQVDNTPVVRFTSPDRPLKAQLRIELADAKGPSFCAMGILVPRKD